MTNKISTQHLVNNATVYCDMAFISPSDIKLWVGKSAEKKKLIIDLIAKMDKLPCIKIFGKQKAKQAYLCCDVPNKRYIPDLLDKLTYTQAWGKSHYKVLIHIDGL